MRLATPHMAANGVMEAWGQPYYDLIKSANMNQSEPLELNRAGILSLESTDREMKGHYAAAISNNSTKRSTRARHVVIIDQVKVHLISSMKIMLVMIVYWYSQIKMQRTPALHPITTI